MIGSDRRRPEVADVKERLIADLKDSGKLPVSLYDSYAIACSQLGQTTAPTDADKSAMDWEAQSQQPDDYRHLLRQIAHCTDASARAQLLDNISGQLTQLMAPSSKIQPATVPPFQIDLQSFGSDQHREQICSKVLLFSFSFCIFLSVCLSFFLSFMAS